MITTITNRHMYYDVYWLEMVILSLNRHAHLKLERCAHTLYMSRFRFRVFNYISAISWRLYMNIIVVVDVFFKLPYNSCLYGNLFSVNFSWPST